MRRLVPAPIRRQAARIAASRRADEVEQQLAAIAADRRPILVGPWLGEVGFELLYWLPFVRWFAERFDITADRMIAMSRGGAGAWYSDLAAVSFDALSVMSPDEYRRRNTDRTEHLGEQKQIRATALDDELVSHVRTAGGRDVAVLHPSLMYTLFAPYWWGHAPVSWVRRYTAHAQMAPPPLSVELPPTYTAVKFYFNDCFTSAPEHRAFVQREVDRLSAQGAVISLSTGVAVDEHAPCEPDIAAMQSIRHLLTPQTNLLVQSAVVSGAARFVGTYGGFAYLAPLSGVPATTYYTGPGAYSMRHLDLIRDVLDSQGRPDLLTVTSLADAR